MEVLWGRVGLALPAEWTVLRRGAGELQLALDDPEEIVTLKARLFEDLALRPDGNFFDLVRPDGEILEDAPVWRPGEDHNLQIVQDLEGRGPHLLLSECLPMGLTGACLLQCCWPLSADLAQHPERIPVLAAASLARVSPVLSAARVEGLRPDAAPVPPFVERAVGSLFRMRLPATWTVTANDEPMGGVQSFLGADDTDPYPCHVQIKPHLTPSRAIPKGFFDNTVRDMKPDAVRAAVGTRPGLMPLYYRPSSDEIVVAFRGAVQDDDLELAIETCVRVRVIGNAIATLAGSIAYPAADRMVPATYALVDALWRSLLDGRFEIEPA